MKADMILSDEYVLMEQQIQGGQDVIHPPWALMEARLLCSHGMVN